MKFRQITIDDYQDYQKYYQMCLEPCSDTSFMAVLEMSFSNNYEIAFADGFYWGKMKWWGEELFMPPVGDWDIDNWEEVLSKNLPLNCSIGFVPALLLKRWKTFSRKFTVDEMREEWDYVYNIDKQIKAEGKMYKDVRKSINHFFNNLPSNYSFDNITEKDIPDILAFQDQWMQDCHDMDKMNEELIGEDKAFRCMINLWPKLPNAIGYILRIDGKIAVYIISEQMDSNIISGRFMKAGKGYEDLSRVAKKLMYEQIGNKYFLVNAGGDAGLPGLRHCKEADNPITLYKKYKVHFNE
jgi:hypothetical protein